MKQDLVIKLSFEGRLKRLSMESDYEKLCLIAQESFDELKNGQFSLNYIDNEHDTISIESQKDYMMAIAYANKINSILKIYAEKREVTKRRYSTTKLVKTSMQTSFIEDNIPTFISLKCESCDRLFNNKKSFEAHSGVCEKVFMTKRIPFNSHLMRMRAIAFVNKITLLHLSTLYTMRKEYPIHFERDQRECYHCHRRFSLNAFEVHMKVCSCLQTKRIPFDSKRQRMISTEIILKKTQEYVDLKKKNKNDLAQWKKSSLRFRNIMKISRMLLRN